MGTASCSPDRTFPVYSKSFPLGLLVHCMCPQLIIRILPHSHWKAAKYWSRQRNFLMRSKVCLSAEQKETLQRAETHKTQLSLQTHIVPTIILELTEIKWNQGVCWLESLWGLCCNEVKLVWESSAPRRSLSSPPWFWERRAAGTTPPLGAAGEFPYRSSWPAGRKQTAGGLCWKKAFKEEPVCSPQIHSRLLEQSRDGGFTLTGISLNVRSEWFFPDHRNMILKTWPKQKCFSKLHLWKSCLLDQMFKWHLHYCKYFPTMFKPEKSVI